MQNKFDRLFNRLKCGLIVSCQALVDEPLYGSQFMASMAIAATRGGAIGIRANGLEDITAIRRVLDIPIIGILKVDTPGYAVRITPTIEHARQVARAGADIIAIDATNRLHPDGISLADRIWTIHQDTSLPVMADISDLVEGLAAEEMGADLVATTLAGYTGTIQKQLGPDFGLLKQLVTLLHVPVIAEGRITSPEQAFQAIQMGAWSVVVGTAITRPQWITEQFVMRLKQ
jgi:N-acylglucosamine-6-phosphate 2-epimerase